MALEGWITRSIGSQSTVRSFVDSNYDGKRNEEHSQRGVLIHRRKFFEKREHGGEGEQENENADIEDALGDVLRLTLKFLVSATSARTEESSVPPLNKSSQEHRECRSQTKDGRVRSSRRPQLRRG